MNQPTKTGTKGSKTTTAITIHDEEWLTERVDQAYDGDVEREDGGRWHVASPFWEITEYTAEEFHAFLEADELPPELAERYKDYLED